MRARLAFILTFAAAATACAPWPETVQGARESAVAAGASPPTIRS